MAGAINNSTGVLDALRYLQSSTKDLGSAEGRLSSGLRVSTAREDVTAYHAAALMKAQSGSLSAVTLSLSRAESISDTAIGASEQISKLLIEMEKTVGAATSNDLSPAQRDAYETQYQSQLAQLSNFIRNASFDDSNILDGSKPLGISFIADSEANASLSLKGRNFLPGGQVITLIPGTHDLSSPTSAQQTKLALEQSIANIGDQLSEMVAENKRIEAQKGFVGRLADALAAGVGRMVDTDLAAESALIQALQIKQELSAQSVGIANTTPQALLSLFR
jgi:flagellin